MRLLADEHVAGRRLGARSPDRPARYAESAIIESRGSLPGICTSCPPIEKEMTLFAVNAIRCYHRLECSLDRLICRRNRATAWRQAAGIAPEAGTLSGAARRPAHGAERLTKCGNCVLRGLHTYSRLIAGQKKNKNAGCFQCFSGLIFDSNRHSSTVQCGEPHQPSPAGREPCALRLVA